MDLLENVPLPNEVVNQWITKLVTYWLTYLLSSCSTFAGMAYMSVYAKDVAPYLPVVAAISIIAFLFARFKPNSCMEYLLTGMGIYFTNIFVILCVVTDHYEVDHYLVTLPGCIVICVLAGLPMYPFVTAATTAPPCPYQINPWAEALLSQGWRVLGMMMISIIAGGKLKSEAAVSSLNIYAAIAYLLFQLASFYPSKPNTTIWLASLAWLFLVPMVLTSLLQPNYPNLTTGMVFLISISTCLPAMFMKLPIWEVINSIRNREPRPRRPAV